MEEAVHRMSGFQRLQRDFERLRSEQVASFAEAHDEQRPMLLRLEKSQAEIAALSAAIQPLIYGGVKCSPYFGTEGDLGGSSSSQRENHWGLGAQRLSFLAERQNTLDERVKALRMELRELVAQEAEQRLEGLQRVERFVEQLRAQQIGGCQGVGDGDASLRGDMLRLARKQAEVLSIREETSQAQSEWWEKAQQRLGGLEESLAVLDGGSQAQGRIVEAMNLRMEELARAHNSVVRASMDREAAMNASFVDLQQQVIVYTDRVRALEEFAQKLVNLDEVRGVMEQWDELFAQMRQALEARCRSLGDEMSRGLQELKRAAAIETACRSPSTSPPAPERHVEELSPLRWPSEGPLTAQQGRLRSSGIGLRL